MSATGVNTQDSLVERLTEYFRTCPYPVVVAYLFGSAARGQMTPLSDVDVGVLVDEADADKRLKIRLDLTGDLDVAGPEVDVALLDQVSSGIAYDIIRGRLLYAADDSRRVSVETRVMKTYLDDLDLYRVQHHLLHARIRAGKFGKRSPEMIDARVIDERLKYIDDMLQLLDRVKPLTLDQFKADLTVAHAALYRLQTVFEAMVDVGNHIISAAGMRRAHSREEIMIVLGKEGVLSQRLAEHLRNAMKMRNLIVHGYMEVDLGAVYQVVQTDLNAIREFTTQVSQYIDRVSQGKVN